MSFETEHGRSVPAVTAEQMRAVDDAAVEGVGLALLSMMENAGRTLAATAREFAAGDGPVVVLAGGGGNGGGGLCAARHLANGGRDVRVVLDRDPSELAGAPERQLRVLRGTDATVGGPDALDESRRAVAVDGDRSLALGDAALLVDALVGYGLTEALRGATADLAAATAGADRVLSLDVPSGLNATTGEEPGVAVDADRTLTLALPKSGLTDLADLWLADIGVPAAAFERAGVDYADPFGGADRRRLRTTGAP